MSVVEQTKEHVTLDQPAIMLLEEHVRRVMEIMGFADAAIDCGKSEGGMVRISVEVGEQGRVLIGAQGAHLHALQHVLRCVLRKQLPDGMRVAVDVNGYRARREKALLGIAEETAHKAQRTGRTIVMQPMSASDRRVVHTALASHKDIKTESLGEEPNRRVVVKPLFL